MHLIVIACLKCFYGMQSEGPLGAVAPVLSDSRVFKRELSFTSAPAGGSQPQRAPGSHAAATPHRTVEELLTALRKVPLCPNAGSLRHRPSAAGVTVFGAFHVVMAIGY